MALTVLNDLGGITSTIVSGFTAAAPPANTIIVDSGLLVAGNGTPSTYLVSIIKGQVGSPDTNYANILVNVGGTNGAGVITGGGQTFGPLISINSSTSGGGAQRFRLTIPSGGAHVYIIVGNTVGGAGAIYFAEATFTRIHDSYAGL